jgi:enoyl-CoA hydratase
MASLVSYAIEGGAVRIGMDDGKLNVLSPQMLAELHEAFERASGEDLPVVLRGYGKAMSAGFDLAVLNGGGTDAADLLKSGFELSERMLSFPAPLVIACPGHAIAMGLFVVLSGDYRIGTSGPFRLTANEVAIGMTLPRTVTELCRYRLLPSYFDRAVALAEVFTPETALSAGILDQVVDPAALDGAADEAIARLGALNLRAHRETKLRAREAILATIKQSIVDDDRDARSSLEAH